MKKEIIDFIRTIAEIRKQEGGCTCFGAEKAYPYFMAISQEDIDFFNEKLREILRAEGIFKINLGLHEDFENINEQRNRIEHPIMGIVRNCFLRDKKEVEEKAKNDFHLFTKPYCAEMDTLILRLIQVFSC
ncbi:MAG: hypothetical protein WCO05_01720 [Candidatus Moraniibacteriota bacterium]